MQGVSSFLPYFPQSLNALALLVALAAAWLLVATRIRERRVVGGPSRRVNRLFYRVAGVGMALALALSWGSTHL